MVRFNSAQHILDQGIKLGMEVYFAPRTRHTAFVFIDNLFKQRGSDASWEHDQEPPESCLDYSDDEQERCARAAHRLKKKALDPNQPSPLPRKNRPKQHERQQGARHPNQQFRRGYNQQYAPPNPFYMSNPQNFPPQQLSSAPRMPMPSNSNGWQGNSGASSALAPPVFSSHPPPFPPQMSGSRDDQHQQQFQPPPNPSYMFPPPIFSPFSLNSNSGQGSSSFTPPVKSSSAPEPPPPGV